MWSRFFRVSQALLVILLADLLLIEPPLQAAVPPSTPIAAPLASSDNVSNQLAALAAALHRARATLLRQAARSPLSPRSKILTPRRRMTAAITTRSGMASDITERNRTLYGILEHSGTASGLPPQACAGRPLLLAQAGAYDTGLAVGNRLIPSFGTSDTLNQNKTTVIPTVIPRDPTCGANIDCLTQQNLNNPYYTQNPGDKAKANQLSQDVATHTQNSAIVGTIQQRVVSPYKWGFGANSKLVQSIKNLLPQDLALEEGCHDVPVCAKPTTVTTEQQCQVSQTVEHAACVESYSIQPDPQNPGGQISLLTDGCLSYKKPPWYSQSTICLDTPDVQRCQSYQDVKSYTSCIDHWLHVGVNQEGNDIVIQKWDDRPGVHRNCGADYLELDRIPISAFPTDQPITVSFTATGQCGGSATVAVGQRVELFACGNDYHSTDTITWTSRLQKCLDCWTTERTFGNIVTLSSTCDPLEAQGCVPSGQACLTSDCSRATKTYSCATPGQCAQWTPELMCSACTPDPPNSPRCVSETYPPNSDFGIAAAAMEGQVTAARDKDGEPKFFPGADERCKDTFLTDCCGSGDDTAANIQKGIQAAQASYTVISTSLNIYNNFAEVMDILNDLKDLNNVFQNITDLWNLIGPSWSLFSVGIVIDVVLMILQMFLSCDASDVQASTKNDLKVCHEVGRYCSAGFLACFEHKTTYCCFSTVLARIIQEQGRAQLGIGWGDPENPACRGLTATELQTIDWTKIDLTEYLADLATRMKWPTSADTQAGATNISEGPFAGTGANIVSNAGSLGAAVKAAIAPPGGWTTNDTTSVPISITVIGSGHITLSPGNNTCYGSCTVRVTPNQPITLSATPDNQFTFDGWSGACSGDGVCALTPTGPLSVTATFSATQLSLSVSIIGKGSITVSYVGEAGGGPMTCTSTSTATCAVPVSPGAVVSLTATPADSSWTFDSWTGDCTGRTPSCTVTMTVPRSVIARFNGTPVITSLAANVTFPVPAGTAITWTTTTVGGTPPIQYRYYRADHGGTPALVQDWSSSSLYTWTTTPADVGNHTVTVLVRNAGSAADFEDMRTSPTFTIMAPLSLISVSPPSASRQYALNVGLTLTGSGFRSGDTLHFTRGGAVVPGITVTSVVPNGTTQLSVTLAIDPATPTGPTDVTVVDVDGATATLANAFTVTL